jgi:cytochrome c-type biogenesis protein
MAGLSVAFLAGLLSFLAPCVLPLVPGYLSTVSAVEAGRLGEPGAARRVVVASLPFLAGFTVVFVALGAGAGALGGLLSWRSQQEIAGFVTIVFGLAFMGLLPWPERLVAPGLVSGARRRGSSVLLGGAFAVCAAPCVGPVLAAILVVAGGTSTLEGSVLLFAYSAGLAVPFLVAGIAFARSMTAFRWLRDRYTAIRIAGGATMVALGLLLFFDRFYLLRVYLNRAFEAVGIGV